MCVRQILEKMREIGGGVTIGDLNMAPAFQRCEQHEQISRSIAFVLIIVPCDTPGFCRNWHTRFGDQLFRRLIQTNQRTLRIARLVIHLEHIFHICHERRVCFWWNDKLLIQVRLENVFFSVRPIVLSLACATMFSSTTLSSSSRKVHLARPFGGSEQVRAINLASDAPSKMRRLAEFGECLRSRTASKPSSTSCWRVRNMVDGLASRAVAICLSRQPSPARETSALSRILALRTWAAGRFPVRISASSVSRSSALSLTTYLLTAFPNMIRFPVTSTTLPESHGNPSKSRTQGTSHDP